MDSTKLKQIFLILVLAVLVSAGSAYADAPLTPITLNDAPAVWQTSSFVVTLTVIENGPAITHYTVDGGADTEGNTVTIDSDGTYTITYYSVNEFGAEDPNSVTVQLDTVAPMTTATASTVNGAYSSGTWTNSDLVNIEFSASDGTSGISSTEYNIDGGEWTAYGGDTFTVSGEGQHTVTYYSTDAAGNVESEQTFDVWIDTMPPVTTDDAIPGWIADSAAINFSPTDELSGVDTTYFLVDGNPDEDDFEDGTSTEVSGEGTHTIYYYSVDAAGNSEEQKTAQLNVDSNAPELIVLGNMGAYGFGGWSKSDVTVTATCNDGSGSGCASESPITYCLGEECNPDIMYNEGEGVIISDEGTTYLTMRATDAVDKTTTETFEIKIDKTAPIVTMDSPADGGILKTAMVDVSYVMSDDGSGLMTETDSDACSYQLDSNDAVKLNYCNEEIDLGEMTNGMHTVTLTAVDNVGNINQLVNSFFVYALAEGGSEGLADSENFTFEGDIDKLVVPVGSPLTSVTAPSTNTSNPVSLDLSFLQSGDKSVELTNDFTLTRDADEVSYAIDMDAGTVISGGLTWDGLLTMPTVKQNSDYSAPTGNVNVVVDMGSNNELTFSKAVKVTIGGMAGKKAGWARGSGALTKIETVCDNADSPTNINGDAGPKECAIDSGADLIIWTYHFTQFAAYTPAANNNDGGSNGGSSGGSSGGGGGSGMRLGNKPTVAPANTPAQSNTQPSQTETAEGAAGSVTGAATANGITGLAVASGLQTTRNRALMYSALIIIVIVTFVAVQRRIRSSQEDKSDKPSKSK